MKALNLYAHVAANTYPGRGIVLGLTPDGSRAAIAYFIMGRSENSRNRVFVPFPESDGIRTQAADPAKLKDPSLIIYAPVRVLGENTIVTNGDQTDTVYDFLSKGARFEDALRTRTFEPDGPNFTPRISGMVTVSGGKLCYRLSILKSLDETGEKALRSFFEYETPVAGQGHFIHTYDGDGSPIPSFTGEPECVTVEDDMEKFTEGLWNSLNADNKVSLFVRYIDLATGGHRDIIRNKYQAV